MSKTRSTASTRRRHQRASDRDRPAGKACALATTEDRLAEHAAGAVAEIEESCADLPDLIALETSGIPGSNTQFYSLTSDGVTVAEWMGDAISAPASVLDRVAEGGLVGSHGATAFSGTVD